MIIKFILIIILFMCVAYLMIEWSVHKDLTQDYCIIEHTDIKYYSFKKFKREFNTIDWQIFQDALVTTDKNICGFKDECFANIIKMHDYHIMINNPISFMIAKIYAYNYKSKLINNKSKKSF